VQRKHFIILLIVVVVSRLPFLFLGYGSDADAWRLARSASQLLQAGVYEPSRLPGYPLHEILAAPFVAIGGAPLANAGTLVACLLLLFVWKQLTEHEARYPSLLILCMAFAPFVWKNSSTTMDYLWSLLAILLSLNSSLKNHPFISGLWVGVAAGFRPTNIIAFLPILSHMIARKNSGKEVLTFLCSTGAAAFVAFLLPILKYTPSGWIAETLSATMDITFSPSERFLYYGYRSVTFVGIPATLAAIMILIPRTGQLITSLKNKEPLIVASAVGVFTFLALYWVYPLEREYLLPALPFGLLLLDSLATKRGLLVFAACSFSLAAINFDVIKHHGFKGTPEFNIHWGVVVEDWEKRNFILELRKKISSLPIEGKAIVMIGGDREVWLENEGLVIDTSDSWKGFTEMVVHQTRNPDVHFINVMNREELERARAAGFSVFCTEWNREYLERIAGYRMETMGVPLISLEGP